MAGASALWWIKGTSVHLSAQGACAKEDPWQLYNEAVRNEPLMLGHIPNRFKTQSMCEMAVEKVSRVLRYVPDHFKTKRMRSKAVEVDPWSLEYVPEDLITREMCNKAVDDCSWQHVPNQQKTREMCNRAVSWHNLSLLQYVTDWFVTKEQIKFWHNDYYKYCYDGCGEDNFFWWHEGYKERQAQKASIKEELMPIAWHPNRVMD